jgi:hypothetical protein
VDRSGGKIDCGKRRVAPAQDPLPDYIDGVVRANKSD